MSTNSISFLFLALFVLLIFSAFSSGSETGMMASNKVKIDPKKNSMGDFGGGGEF